MPRSTLFATLAAVGALSLALACGGGGGGGAPGGGGASASPPLAQPASGPGSATYAYATVVESAYGTGSAQYWIFEPAGSGTTALPAVLFLHGYGAMQPDGYRAWIDHLVLRGRIVIYPRYQSDLLTSPSLFTGNVLAAVAAALVELGNPGHAVRDAGRFAVVGHSYGGVLAAHYAALTDAAWFGTNREFALGDTPEQRFLGLWSDAVPVVEPLVTDAP